MVSFLILLALLIPINYFVIQGDRSMSEKLLGRKPISFEQYVRDYFQ